MKERVQDRGANRPRQRGTTGGIQTSDLQAKLGHIHLPTLPYPPTPLPPYFSLPVRAAPEELLRVVDGEEDQAALLQCQALPQLGQLLRVWWWFLFYQCVPLGE